MSLLKINQKEKIKHEKKPHPLVMEVKKMLKEYNMEYASPQVIANLTCIAENMAIELLKSAEFYSQKNAGGNPGTINKNDIKLAINLRYQDCTKLPDEDAMIDAAVAVNGNPLFLKDIAGIPLPKDNFGNCNYRLHNPHKKLKIDVHRDHSLPYYSYLMSYNNYKSRKTGNINMNNYLFKNPMQMRPMDELPMKVTVTPTYEMLPTGQSMLKKKFNRRYR